ncbi:MAG: hypothetical protein NTX03_10235, partial [Bacteroidetes bacterium]|nr:hypothetical protein [Bacteroidota bacterium]
MQRLFTLFFLLMASYSFGQNVTLVQIERAGILTNRFVDGKEVRLLKNDVAFRQGDVFMTCDSAYQYEKDNKVTAFGNVHITQHDTLNLYGQLLDYDGNTKYAVITRNVRMQDRRMTLLTERLEYNMKNKNAYYSTGAVITQDDTKLTSKKGNYVAATRDFYFKENVILTNPKYVIKCDTLQYNTATNTSYFHGPTNITTKNDSIYCETGSYNTTSGEAHFGKNASLTSKGQILYGDSLEYYRDLQMGRARGNVRMIDTTEKMTAFGAYAEHYEKTNETFITGNPLVSKKFETDTVYITGDTLRSRYDSIGKYKIIRAHKHVKVYGRQFQAKCDSLIYSFNF